jgi:hypothetical protein
MLTFTKSSSSSFGPRTSKSAASSAPSKDGQDSWLDRFKPHTVKDVALSGQAKNKVKDWLERAVAAHATAGTDPYFKSHVLAFCGNSGCGKSTLIEALCKDMNIDVITWSDDSWDIDMKENQYLGGSRRGGAAYRDPFAHSGGGGGSLMITARGSSLRRAMGATAMAIAWMKWETWHRSLGSPRTLS